MPAYLVEPILSVACFAIVLGSAWAWRGRQASVTADRWAIASGLLVAVGFPWLLAALLGRSSVLLIPLERLFAVLVPAAVGWAAFGPRAGSSPDRVLTAVLAAAGLLFTASLAFYPGSEQFNVSSLDLAWSVLALAVGSAAVLGLAFRRPAKWAVFATGLTMIVGGTAVHVAANPPAPTGAPSILLSMALASPVLAIGAVIVLATDAKASFAPATPTDSLSPRAAAPLLRLAEARDGPSFAAALCESIGITLRADVSVVLMSPSGETGFSVLGGYDSARRLSIPAIPLDPQASPAIVQAIEDGRFLRFPAESPHPDVQTILQVLGASALASGLLVPLSAEGAAVGGLLLLSAQGKPALPEEARRTLEGLAPGLGERLGQITMATPDSQGMAADRLALARAHQQIEELQTALAASSERDFPWVGLDDLQAQLAEAYQTIETLEAELARIREVALQPRPREPEVDRLRAELALALSALADARQGPEGGEPRSQGRRSSNGFTRSIDEARQPLAAIAGYTELLLGESIGLLGANQRKFLERIRAAVRRMEESLARLAAHARSSVPPPSPERSDLAACIEQALEVLHEDLHSRGLSVRLDLPAQVVPAPADADTIRTIISDLLTNAAAATASGREIHLSLHADDGQGVAILAITDRGRGVAADDLHRVFTASRWGDPVRGLGIDTHRMARVKALAESIGGRAWVERDPAGGTTFFILFPTLGAHLSLS